MTDIPTPTDAEIEAGAEALYKEHVSQQPRPGQWPPWSRIGAHAKDLEQMFRAKSTTALAAAARVRGDAAWRPIAEAPDNRMVAYLWVCGGGYSSPTLLPNERDFWLFQLRYGSQVVPTTFCPVAIPAPPVQP